MTLSRTSPLITALAATATISLAGASFAQSCQSDPNRPMVSMASMDNRDGMNIVETAVDAGSVNTLAAALKATGLDKTLSKKGPFTVFAPTDDAFAKLPKGTVETLLKPENRDTLTAILTYHVVPGEFDSSAVTNLGGLTTVNGQRLGFGATNGTVMIDSAAVTATDITANNGVIHVIDTVMMPTSENIVEVAQSAGQFNTLIAAAKAAGLVPALTGDQPLTVLAPTDDAFAKLPNGTVQSLLKPENKSKLAAILKYHVIPGRVYADQAVTAQSAKTLQGGKVFFDVRNGRLNVNGAKVLSTDIDASNGVVHGIDTVILP